MITARIATTARSGALNVDDAPESSMRVVDESFVDCDERMVLIASVVCDEKLVLLIAFVVCDVSIVLLIASVVNSPDEVTPLADVVGYVVDHSLVTLESMWFEVGLSSC